MKKTWKIIFGGSSVLGLLTFIVLCIKNWIIILPVLMAIGLFFQTIFIFLIQPYFLGVYCMILIFVFYYQIKKLVKRNRKKVIGIEYDYEGITYTIELNHQSFIYQRCSKCGVNISDNYCVKCKKDFSYLETEVNDDENIQILNKEERLKKKGVSDIMIAEYRKYLHGEDHELKLIYNN